MFQDLLKSLMPVNSNLDERLKAANGEEPDYQRESPEAWKLMLNILKSNEGLKKLITETMPSLDMDPHLPLVTCEDFSEIPEISLAEVNGSYGLHGLLPQNLMIFPGMIDNLFDHDAHFGPSNDKRIAAFKRNIRPISVQDTVNILFDQGIAFYDNSGFSCMHLHEFVEKSRERIEAAAEQVIRLKKFGHKNYAYFVVDPADDPNESLKGQFIHAYESLKGLFEKKGFRHIKTGMTKVTKKDIIKTFIQAEALPEDAQFVFVYMGHGSSNNGRLCLANGEMMHPREVFYALGNVKAKKYLIINGCHSGNFAEDTQAIPNRTLVITASQGDQVAYGAQLIDAINSKFRWTDEPVDLLNAEDTIADRVGQMHEGRRRGSRSIPRPQVKGVHHQNGEKTEFGF